MSDDREPTEQEARRDRLTGLSGKPEHISNADALAIAGRAGIEISRYVTADDWIYASIYRDNAAWEGWLASNTEHHGHTELLRVPLPDGRVLGILDLRKYYMQAIAEARARHDERS